MAITHAEPSSSPPISGTEWDAGHVADGALELVLDGLGTVLATGIRADLVFPCGGTIQSVTLLAAQSGSLVFDLWKDTYANFETLTVADSICASAKPTLSSASKSTDSTLTGWTKTFSKGDVLRVNLDSCTTITRVTLSIAYKEP